MTDKIFWDSFETDIDAIERATKRIRKRVETLKKLGGGRSGVKIMARAKKC